MFAWIEPLADEVVELLHLTLAIIVDLTTAAAYEETAI
jgi:hypothetical protein